MAMDRPGKQATNEPLSKFLSKILRYEAIDRGIRLDAQNFAYLQHVFWEVRTETYWTMKDIYYVVETSIDKNGDPRFEVIEKIPDDRLESIRMIRATRNHSIASVKCNRSHVPRRPGRGRCGPPTGMREQSAQEDIPPPPPPPPPSEPHRTMNVGLRTGEAERRRLEADAARGDAFRRADGRGEDDRIFAHTRAGGCDREQGRGRDPADDDTFVGDTAAPISAPLTVNIFTPRVGDWAPNDAWRPAHQEDQVDAATFPFQDVRLRSRHGDIRLASSCSSGSSSNLAVADEPSVFQDAGRVASSSTEPFSSQEVSANTPRPLPFPTPFGRCVEEKLPPTVLPDVCTHRFNGTYIAFVDYNGVEKLASGVSEGGYLSLSAGTQLNVQEGFPATGEEWNRYGFYIYGSTSKAPDMKGWFPIYVLGENPSALEFF